MTERTEILEKTRETGKIERTGITETAGITETMETIETTEKTEISFHESLPLYGQNGRHWGFTDHDSSLPPRQVKLSDLYQKDEAVYAPGAVKESAGDYHPGATDFDLGGMIFRLDLPPGTHKIRVECTGTQEDTLISVSGTHPDKIREYEYWDAAGLIPNRNRACWDGHVWTYTFVHGQPFIELEIESLNPDRAAGLRSIRVEPVLMVKPEVPRRAGQAEQAEERPGTWQAQQAEKEQGMQPWEQQKNHNKNRPGEKTAIYILGDSTAKSYVFEEAPMSGWGQCFYRVTDSEKAKVVNYSNGGRSLKTMYIEGRFNDMLLNGKPGDFVLLQSGHNDERDRNTGEDPDGEKIRFGGGSTEEMYYRFLTEIFLPAIRSRGMLPVLVTPVTRIDGGCTDTAVFENSFTGRRFPLVMRKAAADTGTPLLDLNSKSVEYFNDIGGIAAKAVVMAVEPGETPGKTNSGSYANGNPCSHPDGTHYKEALSKQYCRMAAEEIDRLRKEGEVPYMEELYGLLSLETKEALRQKDFSGVFSEVCADTEKGPGAYYRNQIEKLVQLGIFHKDCGGCFRPKETYTVVEFAKAIQQLWRLPEDFASRCTLRYSEEKSSGDTAPDSRILTRQMAACILYDAYMLRFGDRRPAYMTDYNGISIRPEDPNYDSNIPIGETVYYPLLPGEKLKDLEGLPEEMKEKILTVYRLGIMRSEHGIRRGSLHNGELFQPGEAVTREKAAKLLYFCFVLDKNVKTENHRIDL